MEQTGRVASAEESKSVLALDVSELVYSTQSTTVSFRIPPSGREIGSAQSPAGAILRLRLPMNNLAIWPHGFKRAAPEARREDLVGGWPNCVPDRTIASHGRNLPILLHVSGASACKTF